MTAEEINAAIAVLRGDVLAVAPSGIVTNPGYAGACRVDLSDGTVLSAGYWRLSVDGIATLSSSDHGPGRSGEHVDAVGELSQVLVGRTMSRLTVDAQNGDLLLGFGPGVDLCCFRLRRLFEDWEITGGDGLDFWSNHVAL